MHSCTIHVYRIQYAYIRTYGRYVYTFNTYELFGGANVKSCRHYIKIYVKILSNSFKVSNLIDFSRSDIPSVAMLCRSGVYYERYKIELQLQWQTYRKLYIEWRHLQSP